MRILWKRGLLVLASVAWMAAAARAENGDLGAPTLLPLPDAAPVVSPPPLAAPATSMPARPQFDPYNSAFASRIPPEVPATPPVAAVQPDPPNSSASAPAAKANDAFDGT